MSALYDTLTGAKIGYGRVSKRDQNPDAQHRALTKASCVKVFIDEGVSGKLAKRPKLDAALEFLREGDTLVITKLDRLGRSLKNLIELAGDLERRGVDLLVIDQNIDTASPAGKLFFHIVGAFAQFERDMISERTRDGLEAARARGRTGGRKPTLSGKQVDHARRLYDERDEAGKRRYTVAEIAGLLKVSRKTIYRSLDRTTQ